MSIKLPSALTVSGTVVDTAAAPVSGFKVRVKLMAPDAATISTISDGGKPIEATTGTDGRFSLTVKDSNALKQLVTQGSSVLFKSGDDDAADTLDAGLSRTTPLHVNSRQSVQVVLEWQPKQVGDTTKPAIAAKLRIRSVSRDGQMQPSLLVVAGQVKNRQGVPVDNLTISASLVVPTTGQNVEFPQQDERPTADISAQDGTFKIAFAHAGQLVPYQPYSMYGISFTAQPSDKADATPAGAATAPPCYLNPAEPNLVNLRWDTTDPAKPQLSVESVQRNGVTSQPAELTLQALGQLVDTSTSKPLAGHRVQVQAGSALKPLGEVQTNAQGYFPLAHLWPLSFAAEDVSMQWKLQVFDPAGDQIAKDVALTQDGLVESALLVKVTVPTLKDSSPTLVQLLTALGKNVDAKTNTALGAANIKTLKDVLNNGGLRAIKELVKADEPVLAQAEQAADLWSLLPDSVTAATAATLLTSWLGKGIQGTAHLGNLPRAAGTAALKGQIGDFAAAQMHAISVARNNLLNFVLLGSRVEANRQKGSRRASLRSGGTTNRLRSVALLSEETELPCSCEECQTAVSPNAYLTDLIRYVYFRVQKDTDQVSVEDLQSLFFQPFADLPTDCTAMEAPVLTTRLAIEILRAYGAPFTLSGTLATSLANSEAAYRQKAYDAILAELSTSRSELRLALDHDDQLRALADRIGLMSTTQVTQLLFSSADLANETLLESRFGLRKSTRSATDTGLSSTPDLLAWRTQRLRTAWATQDAPTVFPSGVPILDPDVLDFSNLRKGWDSTNLSTTLWLARRAAIDTQLANRALSRAMAVGAAVMTITQPLVTSPSVNEKWAAYLTVSVSSDEIQSAAALLTIEHQDEAKRNAAKQKVANQLRSGVVGDLTTAEKATINAIVDYTGTALDLQVDTQSEAWIDLQFTSLTPISGSAISPIAGWSVIQRVLKGTDNTRSVADVTADLVRFNFPVDAFLRAFDLKLKLHNEGFYSISRSEWAELDAILVVLWKAGQVATWVSEEGATIKVTPDLFWLSGDQPAQRKWLGSADRYQQWQSALQSALSEPIILPSLTRNSAFLSTTSDTPPSPYDLLTQRNSWVASATLALQTARTTVEAATSGKLALFDEKVLAASLLIPKVSSTAHLWFEPEQLQTAYDSGTMTAEHLDQLQIDRNGFQDIFTLRSLIRDNKSTTDQEWLPVLSDLLKAEMKQHYGTWRNEEAASSISLSPVFFQLPAPQPLTFPPQPSADDDPTPLFTKVELQRWRTVLAERIVQQDRVNQDQNEMLDRVEQAVLGGLRDALVGVYGAAAGFPGTSFTERLTDRLLFDFADSPTNKTTRVAQAISTLQLLLFTLRNGNLFRLRTSGTTTLYPNLALEAEHFDTEWQWVGTYGSWRSALFIFMYPENLLNPTLRDLSEQTQPFKDMVNSLRSGTPITPALVKELGSQYHDYYAELGQINVQATCLVTVPLKSAYQTSIPTTPSTQNLCLMFAAMPFGGGKAYWSSREIVSSSSARQSLWNPIPGWANVQRIVGAVPFTSKTAHRVAIIAELIDPQGNTKLQVHSLDLDRLDQGLAAWASAPKDLDLPTSSVYKTSVVVEQVSLADNTTAPTPRPPHLYVATFYLSGSTPQMDVYRRPLNDDATGWGGSDWYSYHLIALANCESLFAGFTVNNYNTGTKTQWNFIAILSGTSGMYGKLFSDTNAAVDLDLTWYLGPVTGVNVIGVADGGAKFVLIHGTNRSRLLTYYSPYYGYTSQMQNYNGFDPFYTPVTQCAETQTMMTGLLTAVPMITRAMYFGSLPENHFRYLSIYISSLSMYQYSINQIAMAYTFEGAGRPLAANESSWNLKLQNAYDWQENAAAPFMLLHVYEARFAVPMHIATQLQQAGFYQEALDWYRVIYDHTIHATDIDPDYGDKRKIFYGLVYEESEPDDGYSRAQNWIEDPFNPHAIAAMRQNSYTRFSLLTIIRCLLDYADSEFAADSAETLPQARTLYLEALQWTDASELALPPECSELVAEMDFSFVPDEWLGTVYLLRSSLAEAMASLAPAEGTQLRTTVTATIKDTATPKWGDRFAKAQAAIRSALKAAPKAPKLGDAVKAERANRRASQLALLSVPQWQKTDAVLRQHIGKRFLSALSDLTGVASENLTKDNTVKLDWLAKPARTRAAIRNPAKRSPVMAQPETAVSRAFKSRWRWDPLAANKSGMAGQELLAAPALALAAADMESAQFLPTSSVSFCIPPNPIIKELKLRGELNLYKLRSGRNINGLQRQLDFYAAPTNAQSGLPSISANGGLALATNSRLAPTEFRYSMLIERARRQIQVAAQFESQLLQALEQADNQRENLLRARNELAIQETTLNLKNLEIQEAQLSVQLVTNQQQRNLDVKTHYQKLINADLSSFERKALDDLDTAVTFQELSIALNATASLAAAVSAQFNAGAVVGYLASAAGGGASLYSTLSQNHGMQASFERRKQDWQLQATLANDDATILATQMTQATVGVQIKKQDSNITKLQIQHAESVVDFLVTKFTNAELFEWMSRIMQGLYAGQLQQATSTARLAQQQLSFDLLQNIDVVQTDYWTVPVDNAVPSGGLSTSGTTDRKGLTGAERLLRDAEQLDEIAAQQTTRKLQLARTISLATLYPGDFQRLKETGEMWFSTTEQDLDLEFPGHYFRRIRKVKVSVLALAPAARGIRATLTNVGTSRVTTPTSAGFDTQILPPSNDSVSYTSPQNASGLFDLDIQPELNLPFEGVGADSLWHFEMPMPANLMDFNSVADVQVTFEYTALNSPDYRAQLLVDPIKLPRTFSGVRAFSFRNELIDQWYALHNPPPAPTDLRVTFSIDSTDFPRGLSNLRVRRLTLYMPIVADADGNVLDLSKDSVSKQIGLAFGSNADAAVQALNSDSLVVAQSAADAWFRQLPAKTLSPFGTWTLMLKPTQAILDLLRNNQIRDILFAVTYVAELPDWPTGLRPKRALF